MWFGEGHPYNSRVKETDFSFWSMCRLKNPRGKERQLISPHITILASFSKEEY
jgi:hypothetical protein